MQGPRRSCESTGPCSPWGLPHVPTARQGRRPARATLRTLRRVRSSLPKARTLPALRGHEGSATAAWFKLFGKLLKRPWTFEKRTYRPPRDPVNALLSLGYTWLTGRAAAQLAALGLESRLGALHDYRPGRPSLACDTIEPFRLPTVDRWVLTLCNEGHLTPADFRDDDQGTRLQPGTFARVVSSWEEHLAEGDWLTRLRSSIETIASRFRDHSAYPPTTPPERPSGEGG